MLAFSQHFKVSVTSCKLILTDLRSSQSSAQKLHCFYFKCHKESEIIVPHILHFQPIGGILVAFPSFCLQPHRHSLSKGMVSSIRVQKLGFDWAGTISQVIVILAASKAIQKRSDHGKIKRKGCRAEIRICI